MKKTRDKARETALDILNRLDDSQMTLDTIIDSVFSSGQQSKLDKAFIYSLVYGVIRWRSRLDWIVKHFSHTKPDKIDPKVYHANEGHSAFLMLERIRIFFHVSVEQQKFVSSHLNLPDLKVYLLIRHLYRKNKGFAIAIFNNNTCGRFQFN